MPTEADILNAKIISTQGKKIHHLLKENKKLRLMLRDFSNNLISLNKLLKTHDIVVQQQEETEGNVMNDKITVETTEELVETDFLGKPLEVEEVFVQTKEDVADDVIAE